MGFGNVKEMMRDLSVSQFTASWARTPMRVWRIHLCWWILHFGRRSVWQIQKLQKCGKRKIFLPHCRSTVRNTPMWKKWVNVWQRKMHQLQICMWRCLELQKGWRRSRVLQAQESSLSSRLWHWRIDVHWWVLCDAVPVVWRPIRLRRWSRRMQISYGHWPMQRLHVSGRFSLSEMELSGWATHELLRRKWRIQLRTGSAQFRDDLSHPRIHVFTLSPMCHDFWLLWWSSRVRRLSDKLVCNWELNTPDCLRWSTLQPSRSRNFSPILRTTVKLVPKSDYQPSQTRILKLIEREEYRFD